ncbi:MULTISPECIES: DMT family transporter [Paenibacillus]|uniref:DMT family transporter n=1 Tax=Paenibacillus TaxID=44249 RepID=UPI001F1A78B5|nr:DMT family transporter [Paenibacillus sp. JJ-223]CAH1198867.1 putative cystine transporter YijE [Paenibacillus sp. JJ-223]
MQLLSLVLCLIWGFNFVIMKLGNGLFPPVLFAAFRFLVGSGFLFLIVFFKRIPLPKREHFKWFVICGILQTTYFNIAIQVSLNYISAGLTSVLTYSMPLFLSLMAHYVIPSDRLTTRKSIGIIVGILGLGLAMDIRFSGNPWILLLALSSAISWAISNLIIKQKLQDCDKVQFTTWQMAFGTIGLFICSLLFEHGTTHWNLNAVLYLLFSGIVASALAFVLWTNILSKLEASKASITLLTVPIIGVLSGWLFLHESFKIATLGGIALVLFGIWIVNSKPAAPKAA